MSYDLTIRSDDRYSRSLALAAAEEALREVPGIVGEGAGYRVESQDQGIYFEMDLEHVDDEGDGFDEDPLRAVNRISLHIPGGVFEASQSTALSVARGVAEKLGWELFDEQAGDVIGRDRKALDVSPIPPVALRGSPTTASPKWWTSRDAFVTELNRNPVLALLVGLALVVFSVLLFALFNPR